MKFTKIFVAAYALIASYGAMAVGVCDPQTSTNCVPTGVGSPVDDLALMGLAVAALVAGVGIIRRKK